MSAMLYSIRWNPMSTLRKLEFLKSKQSIYKRSTLIGSNAQLSKTGIFKMFRSPRWGIIIGSGSILAYFTLSSSKANCAEGDGGEDDKSKSFFGSANSMDSLINLVTPILSKLGFGGLAGVCAGTAVKRIGTEAAYVIGLGFIALQLLSYYGYISIDYHKVEKELRKVADLDGDGKLTKNDLIVAWKEAQKILAYQLPGASGFSAGFFLGLYYGH